MSFLELHAGSGERVLIVEDQEDILNYLTKALQYNGYDVFPAASFHEALTIFENESGNFKLIFSDVVLADKDGVELANIFLKEKPDLRIIMGNGYSEVKNYIKERGFHFLEPYSVERLLHKIRSVIEDKKRLIESV
jgi:DNA-binding NtrC family response regulator